MAGYTSYWLFSCKVLEPTTWHDSSCRLNGRGGELRLHSSRSKKRGPTIPLVRSRENSSFFNKKKYQAVVINLDYSVLRASLVSGQQVSWSLGSWKKGKMRMVCGASKGVTSNRSWTESDSGGDRPRRYITPRCRMLCEVFHGFFFKEEGQPQRWCALMSLFLVVITGSGFSAVPLSEGQLRRWCAFMAGSGLSAVFFFYACDAWVRANFIDVALHCAIRQYKRWRRFMYI